MDQLADGIVDRHDTLGIELAQWHMEGPLSRRQEAQAVKCDWYHDIVVPGQLLQQVTRGAIVNT